MTVEVNFDGLVGPTHHFGGYAYGNIASMKHRLQISHPKSAALEGLQKMKRLIDLGMVQGVLPPRIRPSFKMLRKLGFKGSDRAIFEKAAQESPTLFYHLSSSSFMWAANSATITPSSDTADGKLHITIANLQNHFHRSIEAEETLHLFTLLFPDRELFTIHPPLPSGGNFGDEGAANHTRFCSEYSEKGVHLFVYGKSAFEPRSEHFPFRQAKEASEAVARKHLIDPKRVFFVRQNPEVVESGVFHNDVIAVGNRNTLFYHEKAFMKGDPSLHTIEQLLPLKKICVSETTLTLKEAVESYLFNGQFLTLPSGEELLLLPKECERLNLEWLPIKREFVNLTESMHNGGGPACLRLRCVLTKKEREKLHPSIFLNDTLYQKLLNWIEKHYRETLSIDELRDPQLFMESREALEALTQILDLGSFYEFQQ